MEIILAVRHRVIDFVHFERNADGSLFVNLLEIIARGVENRLAEPLARLGVPAGRDARRDGDEGIVDVAVGDDVVFAAGSSRPDRAHFKTPVASAASWILRSRSMMLICFSRFAEYSTVR
jgi:hypothetical protein